MTDNQKELVYNWSGERLETFIVNEGMLEHLHRYAFTFDMVKDKNVLDIACGEGYGAHLLSAYARQVTGVDIDKATIEKAAKKYTNNNLRFLTGSALAIPLPDNSTEVVVCFETLEHLAEHDEMIKEIKRVLTPDGLLIISTPDKLNYTDRNTLKNPYHVKELYEAEFKALINSHFKMASFYQQKSSFSSIITGGQPHELTVLTGDYTQINQQAEFAPFYHLAVASDHGHLPALSCPSVFRGLPGYETIVATAEKNVKSSITYRTGQLILAPLKAVRSIFYKLSAAKK